MPSSAKQYRKKLHGWLSYAFASEVFVVVSLTLFLPICLEQFARDNGFLLPDRTHPCSSVEVPSTNTSRTTPTLEQEARCVVKIGWAWIDSASFSLYIYSISVALQAITVISMGGIADHPPHRKRLLLCFAALGSIAATIFLVLPSSSPVWYLSALLAVFANVGFGASVVAMNAYIPSLAQESPEVVRILDKLQTFEGELATAELEGPNIDNVSTPLLSNDSSLTQESRETVKKLEVEYQTELSRATSRISSFGIALGYGAGICLLLVTLIPVTLLHGSTFSLRLAIGLSGIWWAVFTIPAAIWLPGSSAYRRGVHLADRSHDNNGIPGRAIKQVSDDKEWNFWKEITAAWIRLGNMLRWTEIKKLGNTFKYLAAWFLLSDGFTTITSTAILFGKTTLHMSPSALILVGVLTPTSGILGSLLWPSLQRRFAWTNLQVLVLLVIMASVIPAYGCLGFFCQGRTKFGGLTTQEEMFGLAIYFGSVYGAFQGYARAFYAELLPPGEEARWYGLFSITDKSSSFIGPLVVGVIADLTGNIRYAFFFLVFMIWLAVPILMCVDVEQGRKDAQAYDYRSNPGNVVDNNINGVCI